MLLSIPTPLDGRLCDLFNPFSGWKITPCDLAPHITYILNVYCVVSFARQSKVRNLEI
jgi:hypothetical protein